MKVEAIASESHTPHTMMAEVKVPDGGYGWWVMICSMASLTLCTSANLSNAMLMMEYTETFEASQTAVGWAAGTRTAVTGLTGVFVGSATRKFGVRAVCMVGGLVCASGLLATAFSPNLYLIYLTFGVVAGTGVTCVTLAATVVVQQYFDKKRPFAAGVATTERSIAPLVIGPTYSGLIAFYGWRGAILIHAGLVLQVMVLGAFFRPLERQRPPLRDAAPTEQREKGGKKLKLLEGSLLKQKTVVLYLAGVSAFIFNITTVMQLTPSRAVSNGMSKMEGALILSSFGMSSLVSRILSGFVAGLSCTNRLVQITLVTVVGGIVTCLSNFCSNFPLSVMAGALYGCAAGATGSIQPTVLMDLVGRGKMAQGQGLLTTISVTLSMTALPVGGWLFDLTQSYDATFYVGGAVQILGGLSFFAVYVLVRREQELKQAEEKHYDHVKVSEIDGKCSVALKSGQLSTSL